MIDCDERPGRPPDRTVCGDRRITWSRLAGAVVDASDSATPSWCVWPWHKCCWDSTLMALAGSAQRCLSKLLSSGRGEVARFGGVGQALGPLTRGGCWSSVDHVPPDISR